MYSCYVHGWSSHHSMCPVCHVVTISPGTTGINQITNAEIDLAFENVSLEDKYTDALKMLEEMAGALEQKACCCDNNWKTGPTICIRCKALDNYRKWKEGAK